jgi:hypothetical protein
MYKNSKTENNAQRTRNDKRFNDPKKEETREKTAGGGYVNQTHYSDGSSTVNWGGPCGSTDYDEYGREC